MKPKKTIIRLITPDELKRLGYAMDAGEIPIGHTEHVSSIYELVHSDGGMTASFSYLKVLREPYGVLLPEPFAYYLTNPLECSDYQDSPGTQLIYKPLLPKSKKSTPMTG